MSKRTGLGKGLGALIKEDEPATAQTAAQEVPLSKIKTNPKQPRKQFDKTKLDELSASIKQHGVLQPILIRPQGAGFEIVAGERRYTAAKQAGLKTIPAFVRNIDEEKVLTLALIENVQRDDLNPLEEALSYRELLEERGFNQTTLAKELSKSRPVISNALRLLELPDDVLKMVKEERISAGHARALLGFRDATKQLEVAKQIVPQRLSVRDVETMAQEPPTNKKSTPNTSASRPKSFSRVEEELGRAMNRNVRIKHKRAAYQLEISFANEADLKKLVKQITQGVSR